VPCFARLLRFRPGKPAHQALPIPADLNPYWHLYK